MNMRKLASAIAKREGKKVEVSIGNIREILRIIVDLEVEWELDYEDGSPSPLQAFDKNVARKYSKAVKALRKAKL